MLKHSVMTRRVVISQNISLRRITGECVCNNTTATAHKTEVTCNLIPRASLWFRTTKKHKLTDVIYSSDIYLFKISKFLFQLRNYLRLVLVIVTARK